MSIYFDPKIDDPEYFYRVQSRNSLLHMQDTIGSYVAPSLWNEQHSHKEYVDRRSKLTNGYRIYTLSVWRNEVIARSEFNKCTFSNKPFIMLKIPRKIIAKTSMILTEDDFLQNKAFLLYEEAPWTEGQVYGASRIPWKHISMTQADWLPLEVMHEDKHVAVKNPYSTNYSYYPEDNNDYGLPQVEVQIRNLLRAIVNIDTELKSISCFNYVKQKELKCSRVYLIYQIKSLNKKIPSVFSAVQRITESKNDDHPWKYYIKMIE